MNYKETGVVGTSWVRANRVIIDNPLGGVGTNIGFLEEKVVITEGDLPMVQQLGYIYEPFISAGDGANITEQFNLIHPVTGAVIGTATYADAQVLLHSLYYYVASKRDNPEVPEE